MSREFKSTVIFKLSGLKLEIEVDPLLNKMSPEAFEARPVTLYFKETDSGEIPMLQYTSLSTYNIKGRGKVFVVENHKTMDNPALELIGTDVIIDGEKYNVKSVEAFAIMRILEGQKIGLLV